MITIDWKTFVISVPKADMTLIQSNPIEIRELNLNTFRLTLKDIEDDAAGMGFQKTHNHNPPVTVGGVTLARVVNILEPYTITFEDGQYMVNLVGANSNVADRTNLNQVSVRSANSAGLIQTREIETASFQNAVHISSTGEAGTLYPVGTPNRPVNNLEDAALIASVRGFKEYMFWSDWTFTSGDIISGIKLVGRSMVATIFTFEFGCYLPSCTVHHATCTGSASGAVEFIDCNLMGFGTNQPVPANDQDLLVKNCLLAGVLYVPENYTGIMRALDCWSTTNGGGPPILDVNDATLEIHVRNFSGECSIRNCTASGTDIKIYLTSGGITLEDTVTAGQFDFRGNGTLTDNSTSVTTLNVEGLINKPMIALAVEEEIGNEVQFAAYNGEINIDTMDGTDSSIYPYGTTAAPCKTLDNVMAIHTALGLNRIRCHHGIVFDREMDGFEVIGQSARTCTCTISGAHLTDFIFSRCEISGIFADNSTIQVEDCSIGNLGNITLNADNCSLMGVIELNNTESTNFTNCSDGVPGTGTPEIQVNDCESLGLWSYSGGIKITHINTPDTAISVNLISGRVIVDSTDTEGSMIVRGIGSLQGTAAGTVINDTGLIDRSTLSYAVWDVLVASGLNSKLDIVQVTVSGIQDGVDDLLLATSSVQDDTTELLARLTAGRALLLDDIEGIDVTVELLRKIQTNRLELAEGTTDNWVLYDDNSTSPLLTWSVKGKSDEAIAIPTAATAKRGKAH